MEFAEIAVEAYLSREGDRLHRGVFARHDLKKTGTSSASARAGIGGEISAPGRLRAPWLGPLLALGRVRRWYSGGRCRLCSGQAGEILLDLAKKRRYRRRGLGARRILPAAGAAAGEHEERHDKVGPPDMRGVFPSSRPKASHVLHWEYPTNERWASFWLENISHGRAVPAKSLICGKFSAIALCRARPRNPSALTSTRAKLVFPAPPQPCFPVPMRPSS